jgi:hypothetical protein
MGTVKQLIPAYNNTATVTSNWLTLRRRVILDKLIVAQLLEELSIIYEPEVFTVVAKHRHWTLS